MFRENLFAILTSMCLLCCSASALTIKNADEELFWIAVFFENKMIDGPWKLNPGETLDITPENYDPRALFEFRPKKHNFYGIWWENENELTQQYCAIRNGLILEVRRLINVEIRRVIKQLNFPSKTVEEPVC